MKKVNILSALTILLSIILMVSCSSADAEPETSVYGNGNVSDATVTYTYTIPQELLDYVMIDAVYNNNANTDIVTEPVLGTTFKVTYRLSKFPITAPVVFVMTRTNRPLASIEGQITMNTSVRMTIGDREIEQDNHCTISAADIPGLINDVHKRTYAVKISKKGDVQFVNPLQY